jgi:predicted AlkP superfamily pyrophosphatase or phosphodiesterase
MLHLMEVDHFQHETGLWTEKAKAAIETDDSQLARIIGAAQKAGIWNETALMVVSDHGFADISKEIDPGVLLREKGLVTLDAKDLVSDWKATIISNSGSAYIYVKDPADQQTKQTLLDTFGPMAGEPGSGILRVITHDQIVEMGGDPDAYLALEAAPGYSMGGGYKDPLAKASPILGTHGYFPDTPAMRTTMLAYGPAIGRGVVPDGGLIDVGPTIASWLGLKLDKAQGAPLKIPRP